MLYHSVINGFGFFICQVEHVNYRKLKERAELTRVYFQGDLCNPARNCSHVNSPARLPGKTFSAAHDPTWLHLTWDRVKCKST